VFLYTNGGLVNFLNTQNSLMPPQLKVTSANAGFKEAFYLQGLETQEGSRLFAV